MSIGAIVFMFISWASVLGLAAWAYYRVLSHEQEPDSEHAD